MGKDVNNSKQAIAEYAKKSGGEEKKVKRRTSGASTMACIASTSVLRILALTCIRTACRERLVYRDFPRKEAQF